MFENHTTFRTCLARGCRKQVVYLHASSMSWNNFVAAIVPNVALNATTQVHYVHFKLKGCSLNLRNYSSNLLNKRFNEQNNGCALAL